MKLLSFLCFFWDAAGKNTTDEELEEMLESGNPSIFTSGVSGCETSCLVPLWGGGTMNVGMGRYIQIENLEWSQMEYMTITMQRLPGVPIRGTCSFPVCVQVTIFGPVLDHGFADLKASPE